MRVLQPSANGSVMELVDVPVLETGAQVAYGFDSHQTHQNRERMPNGSVAKRRRRGTATPGSSVQIRFDPPIENDVFLNEKF